MKNNSIFKQAKDVELEVKNFTTKLSLLVVLFLIVTVLVYFADPSNPISAGLFSFVNNSIPTVIGEPLLFFGELGSVWAVISSVVIMLVLKRHQVAIAITGAGIMSYLAANTIKLFVLFQRPFLVLKDVSVRVPIEQDIIDLALNSNGYPSGHTVAITYITTILWPHITKPIKILLIVIIFLVGTSRVYGGVHFPVDVIGGALLGLLIGMFMRQQSWKYLYSS